LNLDFSDKTILITGGTGSFGNALLKYLLPNSFKEVRIFSRDELKQFEMRTALNHPKIKYFVGDVRDRRSVENVVKGVDYVFHAAALKQVPSCEFFPMQAVMTNVIGSNNVIEACLRDGVQRVVLLSTDKAVEPVNAMGMSKALMEKIAAGHARVLRNGNTTIACVRYGNVMCSRGSVIPLFISQIKKGLPITITAPQMTRFLLKLSDAIDLVLFAFAHANQGDLLIKKAPACTIEDLAIALKNIFQSDVPIRRIGIRHGEKIYETLALREELWRSEDHGDYYQVHMDDRELDYNVYFTVGQSQEMPTNDYTSDNTERLNVEALERLLLSVPEVIDQLPEHVAGQMVAGQD
jgi:UDP-N-acetylglucosamine 4,6-dehydratase/5-epimerase